MTPSGDAFVTLGAAFVLSSADAPAAPSTGREAVEEAGPFGGGRPARGGGFAGE